MRRKIASRRKVNSESLPSVHVRCSNFSMLRSESFMFRLLVDHNQLEISKQKQIFRVLEKFYAEQDFSFPHECREQRNRKV